MGEKGISISDEQIEKYRKMMEDNPDFRIG
jgi:hypothetical protein